jgi:RNA polymerase sigma-70 factor (ECF subfamily)
MAPSSSKGDGPRLWLASDRGQRLAPLRAQEPSLDDQQLLLALRRGDAGAAVSLHDRARPIVDQTVSRLLGRADMDCEDIAQLALIEIVTCSDRFRGECSLDGWISMLTARVVYKHIRRRRTERRIFSGVTSDRVVAVSPNHAGREAGARDLIARIRKHLDALDPNKAWTFLLHDAYGYDLREIAQITGASVAAAQTRLTRGRRELHERIAADPELTDWIEETGGMS